MWNLQGNVNAQGVLKGTEDMKGWLEKIHRDWGTSWSTKNSKSLHMMLANLPDKTFDLIWKVSSFIVTWY